MLARDHGSADEIAESIAVGLADVSDPARQRLAAALAKIPGPQAEATLTMLSHDSDRNVALTASFGLEVRQLEL